MTVRIVTDSACDLTAEESTALDIRIVPLSIRFGNEELVDRLELGVNEFYDRMAALDDEKFVAIMHVRFRVVIDCCSLGQARQHPPT